MTSFVISSPFSLSQTEIPKYHTVQQCYASTRTAQWPSIITVTELHWKLVSHTGSIILQEMNSKMLRLFKLFFLISVVSAYSIRNSIRKVVLKAGGGKKLREKVVASYFEGVQKQNRDQIAACFNPDGTRITDICALSSSTRTATPFELGERCMEFLAAHPDTEVKFHYPPTCGRGKNNRWVFAHWYEEGTWKGISRGIEPNGSPLDVQGQTRFLVNDDLKITEMVVSRTFSEWEKLLQANTASTT